MSDRFNHEKAYRGSNYVEKLKNCITVCGVGALGSNLVDTLTRIGFANIRVVDKDRVEESNLTTQTYGLKDIGAFKVAALRNKVFSNVGVELDIIDKELTTSNVKKLLKDSALVVDVFDNRESRQIIYDYCKTAKIPAIHGGLLDTYGQVTWSEYYKVPANQAEGDVCDYPLSRNIILLTTTVMSDEILDFFLNKKPRKKNWTITLEDLCIKELKLSYS